MSDTTQDAQVITKRRVTMTTYVTVPQEDGDVRVEKHEAVDYVRPDFLDAYVAHAQTQWQHVTVSDEPDAGPGGYHGQTYIPSELNHPGAGSIAPATDGPQDQVN